MKLRGTNFQCAFTKSGRKWNLSVSEIDHWLTISLFRENRRMWEDRIRIAFGKELNQNYIIDLIPSKGLAVLNTAYEPITSRVPLSDQGSFLLLEVP